MSQIPKAFINRIQQQFGLEAEGFLQSLDLPAATSVRLNLSKYSDEWNTCERVMWCDEGRFLEQRPSFTLDPLFHAGCYYPQESSSMIIGWIMTQLFGEDRNITCLDLCAAPGGKSLLLSDYLKDKGRLISNELIKSRNNILREVLTKWGCGNTIVTNNKSEDFKGLMNWFDCVLIDAPCSGEGMFRKDINARSEWSEQNVTFCASRQHDILRDLTSTVKIGGYLIYSTCTFSLEENEYNCKTLLSSGEFEPIELSPEASWNVQKATGEFAYGLHFLPHLVKGEGFFVAVFRRNGDASGMKNKGSKVFRTLTEAERKAANNLYVGNQHLLYAPDGGVYASPFSSEELNFLAGSLFMTMPGIKLGEIIRGELIPAHELAMSRDVSSSTPVVDLSRDVALSYLRGEQINVGERRGWVLVGYQGHVLGWVKAIGQRSNNYYPKEWRIRIK